MTQMGLILKYKPGMPNTWITQRNNELFGRVVKIKRGGRYLYYYYSGLLEDVEYIRLAKGCYFIKADRSILDSFIYIDDVDIINATLDITDNSLYTGKQYFRIQYKDLEVNNLATN